MKLLTLKSIFLAAIMLLMSCEEDDLTPCQQLAIVADQVGESASYTFSISEDLEDLEFDWFINNDAINVSNLELNRGYGSYRLTLVPMKYVLWVNHRIVPIV